jgi:tetratricopeptide (TPR) repeat protein
MNVRVSRGFYGPSVRYWWAGFLLGGVLASSAAGAPEPDAVTPLDLAISAGETSLAKGELPAAEGHYRKALFEGWLLMGTLDRIEGRLPEARAALHKASLSGVEDRLGILSLASAFLDAGAAPQAAEVLTVLSAKDPHDVESRRMLAKALAASGHPDQALVRLDEASAAAGDDPELAFVLGTEYLWLKKADTAQRLFARVAGARPLPQTHILIGRAYRDASEYDRARTELRAALAQDPSTRRAHYYLGMIALSDAGTGPDRLDLAIAEFREELKLEPLDPLTNDQLGVALLDAERPAEALPALEIAQHGEARSVYLYHLGRCQLALDQTAEAVASSRRALELADAQGSSDAEIQKIHYQLGLALRKLGATQEAMTHLAQARPAAASETSGSVPDPPEGAPPAKSSEDSRLSGLLGSQRSELRSRVVAGLARSYLNLGVLQVQGAAPPGKASERFARAAEFFASAAEVAPDFPKVQSSLGVAYFNARQFDKAAGPLERAVAATPDDQGLRRMLAMSLLNTEAWDKAARLLQDDPEREANSALQFTYGLAHVRSRRGAEAETVLSPLLVKQGNSSGLRVLLGQACALQGKDAAAVEHLREAARLSPEDAGIREQLAEATRQLEAKRPGGTP